MIHRNPGRWRLAARQDWEAAPMRVWAVILLLDVLGLFAIAAEVIFLVSAGTQAWASDLAWTLAGAAACTATLVAGVRVRGNPAVRQTWLLYAVGAACWTVGALIRAWTPPGQVNLAAGAFFLCLPVCCIVTFARRVPKLYLFALFLLDAIPVILLILALLQILPHFGPAGLPSSLFAGLYLVLAANAIQMIGIHQEPRRLPIRIWLFTLSFCVLAFAAAFAGPRRVTPGDLPAVWAAAAWTVGLLLLGLAGVGRILRPAGFVVLVPVERQGGPHAIPPAVAVLGLILLLVLQPHPPVEVRVFVGVAALMLLVRVALLYRRDLRLISQVERSRARLAEAAVTERARAERLRLLAEVSSRLKSLVLAELLPAFSGAAREMLGARYAAVGLAAGDGGFSHFVAAGGGPGDPGDAPGGWPGGREPGPQLRPDRPVRLPGPTQRPEQAGFPPGSVLAGGFLAVPLTIGEPGGGVLYVAGKEGGFSQEDESLAELLAASGGHAIINAGLFTESKRQQDLLSTQNEQLRELDRLKDEFVALVSHELRTPLTSIVGYVELLREGESTAREADRRHFTEVIDRNAHRLLHLVGDLLFLSQVQSGQLRMDFRDASLPDIAAGVVEAARPEAAERHVDLRLAAGGCPPIRCDPERIAQLLGNLLSNALKFTPPGGRVEVRLVCGGHTAELAVADTGPGIRAGDRDRIFERFFRSPDAVQRAVPGTGLGLTISKAIVEAHGAAITVDSGEGRGATFRVRLPLRPGRDPATVGRPPG